MRYLLPLLIIAFLTGCHEDQVVTPGKTEVVDTRCPKFTTKLNINVEDLNSTHGAISWKDVSRIESFLKSKKKFNKNIDSL